MKAAEKRNMNDYHKYFEANKKNWNKRTAIHFKSDFYAVDNFLKTKNSLNNIELTEIGDVQGKELLHLQCHFGQDTLSFAKLGAKVTGVDFSEEAIRKGEELRSAMNLDAEFICSNIYDLKNNLEKKFDIIFTSYGTIGWLPDIQEWAKVVSYFLKPGGTFLIVDFHPFIWMLDDDFEKIKYDYFHSDDPLEEKPDKTYTDGDDEINLVQYSWNHTISDLINSLIGEDLKIRSFKEYNYSPYNCFPGMVETNEREFVFKNFGSKIPLIYSLKASK